MPFHDDPLRLVSFVQSLAPPPEEELDDEVFEEALGVALRERPVQLLAKMLVASSPVSNVTMPFPVGDGEVTHKTPRERLATELGLAISEVLGRRQEQEILQQRKERNREATFGIDAPSLEPSPPASEFSEFPFGALSEFLGNLPGLRQAAQFKKRVLTEDR